MNSIKSLVKKHGSPIVLFSKKEFKKSYSSLQKFLPQVKHFYSLKPLPFEECVKIVSSCKGYVDVASLGELEMVKKVDPTMLSRCIYTHPIKKDAEIKSAFENGVDVMVVDNMEEIKKFLPYKDKVKILIRLGFPNDEAKCNLSERYGADEATFKELVNFAFDNQLNIIGASFHVGSQMQKPTEHINAIIKCKVFYDWVFKNHGTRFGTLDIGGGFPAKYNNSDMDLEKFCKPIGEALENFFPNTEIWSEPGRSVAANCMIAVSRVVGKTFKNGKMWYYLDDGVYGTYSGMMYEDITYELYSVKKSNEKLIASIFAGPTCDSVDIIVPNVMFQPLDIGDILFSKRIGAYSVTNRTRFNLLELAKVIPYDFDLEDFENISSSTSVSEEKNLIQKIFGTVFNHTVAPYRYFNKKKI